MLAIALPLTLALSLQAGAAQRSASNTVTTPDEIERADTTPTHRFRPVPVTAEHLATAFEDARAGALLDSARAARQRQDSSLSSYEARAHERLSVGMGVKVIGRERLFLRHEATTRVRWQRGRGAVVDVTGSRFVLPAVLGSTPTIDGNEFPDVPYYPGRDDLELVLPVTVSGMADASLVHPLADGAEAYYHYATGASASFTLPGGRTVWLVELRVRPREPSWRLAVGSLWFEVASAQLVRAVYRLAAPVDLSTMIIVDEEEPKAVAAMISLLRPMKGTFTSFVVEHGLFEGRFWLPRAQRVEGEVQIAFARMPMTLEKQYEYASVNGTIEALPDIPRLSREERDSIRADSLGLTGDARREWMEDQHRVWRDNDESACDAGAVERTRSHRPGSPLPVLVRIPCDTLALMTSPDLAPSIFDTGEVLFTEADLAQARQLLGFDAQAGFAPRRPTLIYGPAQGLLRYNRVEGLSAGLGARMQLGAGLAVEGRAQLAFADREPAGEIAIERSAGTRTVELGAYRRLVAANDWGTPLAFGASVSAFLFGRDEGFYYRTLGAELIAVGNANARFEWRLFAERHDAVERETHFSLPHALHGLEFQENIAADEGTILGAGARLTRSLGVDPRGLRLFGDVRLEGAAGDFTYLRGAVDLTVSRTLTERLAGALTLSGGTTTGELPTQRHFYLGGTQTVRGQTPGTSVGPAYWMVRAELGTSFLRARPVVFYDVGWAGDRGDWRTPGRPMSGAGLGVSFLDGLVRLDLARGIRPLERWTMNLHLGASF